MAQAGARSIDLSRCAGRARSLRTGTRWPTPEPPQSCRPLSGTESAFRHEETSVVKSPQVLSAYSDSTIRPIVEGGGSEDELRLASHLKSGNIS